MSTGDPDPTHGQTLTVAGEAEQGGLVRSFRLVVMEGPKVGTTFAPPGDRCSIGSHESNDLVIDDPTVSRFHCEIRIEPAGATLVDLQSRNGTVLDGVVVREALLRGGSLVRLGKAVVQFQFGVEPNRLPLSKSTKFGRMVGGSAAIRGTFAVLERSAKTDATILLEGETGTGKGAAASSIHMSSPRASRPLVVIDCGAIPLNLLESELFGHEKGAFTGATARRVGAFEEADGGTVFLDEIGELPLDLQPKLLRVLESREIRRVGANLFQPVNVRLIAATNRDLRAEVNAGRFRSDLYFRLAVVKVTLPPLRQRPEDIAPLVEEILTSLNASDEQRTPLRAPAFLAALQRAAWPGNVRELRNYLERCLIFPDDLGVELRPEDDTPEEVAPVEAAPAPAAVPVDLALGFTEARRQAIDHFEREYLRALLAKHHGKVVQAAAAASVDRVYLYKLLKRHGLNR